MLLFFNVSFMRLLHNMYWFYIILLLRKPTYASLYLLTDEGNTFRLIPTELDACSLSFGTP